MRGAKWQYAHVGCARVAPVQRSSCRRAGANIHNEAHRLAARMADWPKWPSAAHSHGKLVHGQTQGGEEGFNFRRARDGRLASIVVVAECFFMIIADDKYKMGISEWGPVRVALYGGTVASAEPARNCAVYVSGCRASNARAPAPSPGPLFLSFAAHIPLR